MKKMKKALAALLCLALCLGLAAAAYADGEPTAGTWGSLTWTLDADGLLTVSGSGDMNAFSSGSTQAWRAYKDRIKEVIILSGVTSVGDDAFLGCSALTDLTLPQGVKRIGSLAFNGCAALANVTIPKSLESVDIYAFFGTVVSKVYYSGTAAQWTEIGIADGNNVLDSAVKYFTTIGGTWKDLRWTLDTGGELTITGSGSMADFSAGSRDAWRLYRNDAEFKIRNISIHDGVTSIGSYAFSNCDELLTLQIPSSGLTRIGDYAFSGCAKLNAPILAGVADIGSHAFTGCTGFTSVDIPASVTNIGEQAFIGCTNISAFNVVAENMQYASADGVFFTKDGKTLLQAPGTIRGKYVIPDGTASIAPYAFYACTELTGLTVPASVTVIGAYAFSGCTGLNAVEYHAAQTTWAKIDIGAGNEALEQAHIRYLVEGTRGGLNWSLENGVLTVSADPEATDKKMADFSYNSKDAWLNYKDDITGVVIADGVENIGNYAFAGCKNLQSADIPTGVTGIGVGAFSDCAALRRAAIPAGVTSIARSTFYNCASLTNVSIPASVTSISGYAFYGCAALSDIEYSGTRGGWTEISVSTGNEALSSAELHCASSAGTWGDLKWTLDAEGVLTISGSGKMDNFIMGSSDAWQEDKGSITELRIADGVTSIGSVAFLGCSALRCAEIPESVTEIGTYAFYGCSSLSDVIYAGSESTWDDIVVGVENTPLQNAVFHFNGSFYATGTWAGRFSWTLDSEGLLTISGSGSMENFPTGSLSAWQKYRGRIVDVMIAEGAASIGGAAFSGCRNLESVTFPASVTAVGKDAFTECGSLRAIFYNGSLESWDEINIAEGNEALAREKVRADTHAFTVSFNSNGGSGSFASQKKIPGKSLTLASGIPSRVGWFFLGWAETADATAPTYLPGDLFKKDADTTLFAVWTMPEWDEPDLVLPAALTVIGEEAFANCAFHYAVVPEGATEIRSGAFSGCGDLLYIAIPQSCTSIDANAFDGVIDLSILGAPGSYAQTFAAEHGFTFIPAA